MTSRKSPITIILYHLLMTSFDCSRQKVIGESVNDTQSYCLFQKDLGSKQCFGLHENKKDKSADGCRSSCCKMVHCTIWQHHPEHGCWVGSNLKSSYSCTERDSQWTGEMYRVYSHRKTGAEEAQNRTSFRIDDSAEKESSRLASTSELQHGRKCIARTAFECRTACEQSGCNVWLWNMKPGAGCYLIDSGHDHTTESIDLSGTSQNFSATAQAGDDDGHARAGAAHEPPRTAHARPPSAHLPSPPPPPPAHESCCPGRWCCASGAGSSTAGARAARGTAGDAARRTRARLAEHDAASFLPAAGP